MLLHIAFGEAPAQIVFWKVRLVAVGHAVRAVAHGADEDKEILGDLSVFLQLPQTLLTQAVVARQHEGVQAQPVAHGAGEMAHQVVAGGHGLQLLQLCLTAPYAKGGLGAEKEKQTQASGTHSRIPEGSIQGGGPLEW